MHIYFRVRAQTRDRLFGLCAPVTCVAAFLVRPIVLSVVATGPEAATWAHVAAGPACGCDVAAGVGAGCMVADAVMLQWTRAWMRVWMHGW